MDQEVNQEINQDVNEEVNEEVNRELVPEVDQAVIHEKDYDLTRENALLKRLLLILSKYRCFMLEKCICLRRNVNEKQVFDLLDKQYNNVKLELIKLGVNEIIEDIDGSNQVHNIIDDRDIKEEPSDVIENDNSDAPYDVEMIQIEDNGNERRSKRRRKRRTVEKKKTEIESSIGRYKCTFEDCNYSYVKFDDLTHHVNSRHLKIKPYECPNEGCDLTFHSPWTVKAHLRKDHKVYSTFKCLHKPCNKRFIEEKHMRLHYDLIHGQEEGKEDEDNIEDENGDVSDDGNELEPQRPYANACKYAGCNFIGRRMDNLLIHVNRVHLNIRPFKCTVEGCDKTYCSPSGVRGHIRIGHNKVEKNVSCRLATCKTKFISENAMKKHMKLVHTERSRTEACVWPGCDKAFKTYVDLKRHLMTHSDNRKYPCTWPGCQSKFSDKAKAKQHKESVHLKIKNFKCEHNGCDMKFYDKKALKKHVQNIHSLDPKPHACDWPGCDFATNSIHAITHHKQLHSGQKPYACPKCDKRFAAAFYLDNHMAQHSEEKPYKCSWPGCDKAFASKPQIGQHLRKIHRRKNNIP